MKSRLPFIIIVIVLAITGSAFSATRRIDNFKITSSFPTWLAPGGKLEISGFAGAQQDVVLKMDLNPIKTTTSGAMGGFSFSLPINSQGKHHFSLSSNGEEIPLGNLLVRPLTIAAVGDVTPGEAVGPTISARGAAYPWVYVGKTLRSADIATANLEGAISSRGNPVPDKQFHFEGPVALLTGAVKYGGIDVVTLANNHTLDYGSTALLDTLHNAQRAGLPTVGAGRNSYEARRPVYIDRGGLRVAFLGYSDVNPFGFVSTSSTPGTARAETSAIEADVRAARKHADLVVCWFHWGEELHPYPNSNQRLFASSCIKGGAKLILGAHPHVFGPVTRPTSSTLVAWTLGNFVFPSISSQTLRSGILVTSLSSQGVSAYHIIPVMSGVQPRLR